MAYSCDATEESNPRILHPESTSSKLPLEEVPREYFVQSLRALAPNYWEKPETSDCTLIVPVPQLVGGSLQAIAVGPPSTSQAHVTTSNLYDPSGSGRRATEPTLNLPPRLRLQLHADYLTTHSSYIRALLSGTLDPSHATDVNSGPQSNRRYSVPENRMPRLLPGPPNHPILYLPVPDPSSFYLIVHWMYFGDVTYMEECLVKKLVYWEGLARNVEYLGVSSELKIFLQMWYYKEETGDFDESSDTVCSDSDDNSELDDSDSTTASGDESDLACENEKEPSRGRPRIRLRPLSYQQPGTMPWCS